MSAAARISIAFGLYALGMGAGLVALPGFILPLLGLPVTTEPWVRIVGAMALVLGVYYVEAGRHELVAYFRASVVGRFIFAAVSVGCGAAWALPAFYLFAAVDGGSALVTAYFLWKARPAT